jgi:glutathione S-transferase
MLEEIGAPYETKILDYGGAMKSAAFLAINPMGKVPAITHGAMVVTETSAICAYLADAFPEAHLAPPLGDIRRGAYFRWLFFAAGPLEAVIMNKAMGFEAPKDQERMAGYGRFETLVGAMEAALAASPFLTGDVFSAADLYFGAQLGWAMRFGVLERSPVFEAYWTRISSRPAYARAEAIDDALLPPPGPKP